MRARRRPGRAEPEMPRRSVFSPPPRCLGSETTYVMSVKETVMGVSGSAFCSARWTAGARSASEPALADLGSAPVEADVGSAPVEVDVGSAPVEADAGSAPALADALSAAASLGFLRELPMLRSKRTAPKTRKDCTMMSTTAPARKPMPPHCHARSVGMSKAAR
jgi:hypothetical protein